MLLGCIADDFTGASDLANTLAKGGMATTQFVGVPDGRRRCRLRGRCRRAEEPDDPGGEAIAQSLHALDWLLAQGCRQILFKYCSTFDSTPEGNIGPVAEALLDRLGGMAVVCPVFPATGRTLFNGHLFVGDRLLSETGMRDHPLTPMTDPDIRRWLRRQTKGDVGLVPYATVRGGSAGIRAALAAEQASGRRLVVTDAVADADLIAIGEAIAEHRLVTGGSGIALGLPANFRKAGLLSGRGTTFTGAEGPVVALSGSCSQQSLKQVEHFTATHPALAIAPDAVMSGAMDSGKAFAFAMERLSNYPMIYSSAAPEAVKAAQSQYGREAVAERIERLFAELAVRLAEAGVTRIVVGGGETSGAVATALGGKAFAIGPEIDPGVPALAVEGSAIRLALKSGNFGAVDFYEKAARVLAGEAS